ncbi:hypothetical protein [Deinococcus hohokamensis]|uniref:Terminase small subunit n=1 Tax=Deinococcus hohokamensis TaxID=309883 RepID=A0ABV9I6R2_9DEIO
MPSPAKPKKKPSPKSNDRSRGAKPQGRPPAYNWTAIRREYIRGDDGVTLDALSAESRGSGYPSLSQVKRRSSAEDWPDLRAQFRAQTAAKVQQLDLETTEEVRIRQAKIGKAMQTAAVRGLAHVKPEELGAFGVARLAMAGAQLERQARGMKEYTVRIEDLRSPADLKRLNKDQLQELLERRRKARGAHQA